MPVITLRTRDHPEANGRRPVEGEHQWEFTFPLECGSTLRVLMGDKGLRDLRSVITDQILDEQAQGDSY